MKTLITSFGPFDSRAKNGSATFGGYLSKKYSGNDFYFLELAVIWGEIEQKALPLIEQIKPQIIIGFGEGKEEVIAIETRARNWRSGTDIRGKQLEGERIEKNGPAERKSRVTIPQFDPLDFTVPIIDSNDAGQYLCNNALYCFLGTSTPGVSFIHLPQQGNYSDVDYVHKLDTFFDIFISTQKEFKMNSRNENDLV